LNLANAEDDPVNEWGKNFNGSELGANPKIHPLSYMHYLNFACDSACLLPQGQGGFSHEDWRALY